MFNTLAGYGLKHRLQRGRRALARALLQSQCQVETRSCTRRGARARPLDHPYLQTLPRDFRHWRRREAKSVDRLGSYRASVSSRPNFVGPEKIWGCRNLIGPLGIRNGRQVLGADVRSKPPHHEVSASMGRTVAGKRQHKLVRDFAPKGVDPDAPVRHVGDQAVFRRAAFGRPEFCQTLERVALRLASIFRSWRRHARALVDHFRSNEAWAPCDRPNKRARIFRSFVEISRAANLRDSALPVFSMPRIVPRNDLRPSMADKRRDQISVPLDPDLRAQLEQRARLEDRPLAALIRLLCRQGLAQGQERAA
jgi:hypothetical protein